MFYASQPSPALRFGDIVRGFVAFTPCLKTPLKPQSEYGFSVEVIRSDLFAILSPCCSIKDRLLLLAPLLPLRPEFFTNPYFAEDLTRINRKMSAQNAIPPKAWDNLDDQERQERLNSPPSYAFLELFVYDHDDRLPEYELARAPNGRAGHFMVDFRHAFRVNCADVIKPDNSPVDSKILELSIAARGEMRDKIASFFQRVPAEDVVV